MIYSMRKPLMNIKYANDKFNFVNRLNHKYEIGKLNIRKINNAYSNSKHAMGLWKDWKPECDLYCQVCEPLIVKSKLYNRNPIRDKFKKLFCRSCKTML